MFVLAELGFKNYVPEKIEKGMFFHSIDLLHIWKSETQDDDVSLFTQQYGFPLTVSIMTAEDDDVPIVEDKEILFELYPGATLRNITANDVNRILDEFEGMVEIDVVDPLSGVVPLPVLVDGKIVIRCPFFIYQSNLNEEEDE